jgi:DUF177 domain-containing protein
VSAGRALGTPLVWNVAGLLTDTPGATRDYEVSGVTIDLGEDLRLAEPIEGHVRLARTNRGLIVSANLRTAIEAECSRCLREIEVPIDIGIEEEALPSIDIHTGQPVGPEPGTEDDEPLRLTDHHELDLETTVREAIQLAEPIAPLCREDCPGLCAVCGERLDEGVHDHPADDVDPRLAALRDFRPES